MVSGPSALTNPLFLHASENRSYFVAQDGSLTIWGDNFANAATPPAPITDAAMAMGGRVHSVVLHDDGTVTAFGDNGRGQTNVPSGLSGVIEIACGDDFNLALKSDGTVQAWGYNNRGQTNVPAGLSGVAQVQCGAQHAVALKDDGTVQCWGKNSQGQCNVPALSSSVVQISVTDDDHNLAVLDTGELIWWGLDGGDNGEMIPPANTLAYMPTSAPSGSISSLVAFSADFVGDANINGSFSAPVSFLAGFNGGTGPGSDISAGVQFTGTLQGSSVAKFGAIGVSVSFGAQFSGFQDWLSKIGPVQLQELYLFKITGSADGLPDKEFQIANWQATNQAGNRQSYLQAVIPAADALIEGIEARQSGELVISKGYRFSDGTLKTSEILRSNFDTLRYDRSGRNFTVTVSGYLGGKQSQNAVRTLTGIRTLSVSSGKHRVRCDIDLFLQPGMTVIADGVTFTSDYINYFVSETDKFCEVSER
jgi:hypothetical protein